MKKLIIILIFPILLVSGCVIYTHYYFKTKSLNLLNQQLEYNRLSMEKQTSINTDYESNEYKITVLQHLINESLAQNNKFDEEWKKIEQEKKESFFFWY